MNTENCNQISIKNNLNTREYIIAILCSLPLMVFLHKRILLLACLLLGSFIYFVFVNLRYFVVSFLPLEVEMKFVFLGLTYRNVKVKYVNLRIEDIGITFYNEKNEDVLSISREIAVEDEQLSSILIKYKQRKISVGTEKTAEVIFEKIVQNLQKYVR